MVMQYDERSQYYPAGGPQRLAALKGLKLQIENRQCDIIPVLCLRQQRRRRQDSDTAFPNTCPNLARRQVTGLNGARKNLLGENMPWHVNELKWLLRTEQPGRR
jgi:hypothetical protein